MFDIKTKLLLLRNRLKKMKSTKIENKENNVEKDKVVNNIRKDIIDVSFEDDFIVIDIKDECKFFDYSYTIDECYSELRNVFIPMKIFITNGGNMFNYVLFKQKIYIFKNNNCEYMIAVSDNLIRISMRETKDEFIYETELDYKIVEKDYTIYKMIHDLNFSTKCPKWYPEDENSPFYLDKEEAKEMTDILFNNLKTIKNINSIIKNLDEIENIVMNTFCKKKKL